MQNLSPIGWAMRPLKRYAEFSGRSSRAEFWWFMLAVMLIYCVLLVVGFALAGSSPDPATATSPLGIYSGLGAFMAVIGIYWLALLVPTLAVTVRRLHDTNRSGWWLGAYVLLYVAYMVVVMGIGASAGAGVGPDAGAGLGIFILILSLAFFAYAIALLVFYCLPGTRGPNRFGDDPYGPDVEQVFA